MFKFKLPDRKTVIDFMFNLVCIIAFLNVLVIVWFCNIVTIKLLVTLILINTGIFILNRVIK